MESVVKDLFCMSALPVNIPHPLPNNILTSQFPSLWVAVYNRNWVENQFLPSPTKEPSKACAKHVQGYQDLMDPAHIQPPFSTPATSPLFYKRSLDTEVCISAFRSPPQTSLYSNHLDLAIPYQINLWFSTCLVYSAPLRCFPITIRPSV